MFIPNGLVLDDEHIVYDLNSKSEITTLLLRTYDE